MPRPAAPARGRPWTPPRHGFFRRGRNGGAAGGCLGCAGHLGGRADHGSRRSGGPVRRNRVAAPPEAPPAPLHEASRARPAAYRFPDSRRAFRPAARPRRPGLRRAGWGSRQPAGWKRPRSDGPALAGREGPAARPDSTGLEMGAGGSADAAASSGGGAGRRRRAKASSPRGASLGASDVVESAAEVVETGSDAASGAAARGRAGAGTRDVPPPSRRDGTLGGATRGFAPVDAAEVRHQWRSPGMAPATDPPPVVARHPR